MYSTARDFTKPQELHERVYSNLNREELSALSQVSLVLRHSIAGHLNFSILPPQITKWKAPVSFDLQKIAHPPTAYQRLLKRYI